MMPRKVPFRIVSCSGWEDEYHPSCLEVHNPFVKGWRSPRWCLYPQELIVKLKSPSRIRKLQFLSHQYLIPSKIELCVGDLSPKAAASQSAQFRTLGYISLSDNEQTGFRSRELKSVSLDVTTQLIKLVFYPNHINQLNVFNQVGLVALNVIADVPNEDVEGLVSSGETIEVPTSTVHQSPAPRTDPILLGDINKSANISPMDDLTFDVAQDPETAQVIRRLEALKLAAVREENFELAKKIKDVASELQKVGEILCQYEVEKKLAIEREDYVTAKDKKLQGEHLRTQVYEHWGVMNLLSGAGPSHRYTDRDHARVKDAAIGKGGVASSMEMPSAAFATSSSGQVPISHSVSQVPVHHNTGQVLMPRSTSQVPVSHNTNLERQLPSLNNSIRSSSEMLPPSQGDAVLLSDGNDVLSKPEPMTDKQLNECSYAVEAFGTEALDHICSKQYLLREKGLNMVLLMLPSLEIPSRKELTTTIKAVCQVLSRGLNDQVLPTFTLGVELLKYLLGPYAQKHRFLKSDFSFIVGKVAPVLLTRAGDMAPRMRTIATDTILYIAHHDDIKKYFLLGPFLVQPVKHHSSCRLVVARLEVMERFLQDISMEGGGLTLEAVMEIINICLVHVNKMVRDIAVRITLDLYKLYGAGLRAMLPPGAEDVKNKTTVWKALFDGFDKIDGVPSDADRKDAAEAIQVSKQNEIKKLQSQLKVLRELTAKGPSLAPREAAVVTGREVGEPGIELTDNATALDTTCVFCGEKKSDNDLEPHYLTECPMLAQCTHCSQVVEIPELKSHWLTECEGGGGFKECSRCRTAVPTTQYSDHIQANSCSAVADVHSNICPLCHQVVPSGDMGWKDHLLGTSNLCAMNPRTQRKGTHPTEPHPAEPHPAEPPPPHDAPVGTKGRQTKKRK